MAAKPWKSEPGGAQLEAFVGAWGVPTSTIESTEELIFSTARVFEIPPAPTCAEMAQAIEALGKKERKRLAQKNLRTVFGGAAPSVPTKHIPSEAEIDAARTPEGGWTKAALASWGVPWPPPKGWREGLAGEQPSTPAASPRPSLIETLAQELDVSPLELASALRRLVDSGGRS